MFILDNSLRDLEYPLIQGNLVDLFGDQRKIHYNININKRLAQFVGLWYQVEA